MDGALAANPKNERQKEVERRGGQRDPARGLRAPARGEPGKHAGDERNDDEPDEHHENTTIARNSTEPTAIPAAYQRTSPVCVTLERAVQGFRKTRDAGIERIDDIVLIDPGRPQEGLDQYSVVEPVKPPVRTPPCVEDTPGRIRDRILCQAPFRRWNRYAT